METSPSLSALVIILATALLGLGICAVPLRIRALVEFDGSGSRGFFSVTWLGMGIRRRFPSQEGDLSVVALGVPVRSPFGHFATRRPIKSPVLGTRGGPSLLRLVSGVLSHLPEFIDIFRRIARSFSIRHLRCKAEIGLGSPAETGIFYGYFWAAKSIICAIAPSVSIVVTPDFSRNRFEGEIDAEVMVRYPFMLPVYAIRVIEKTGIFSRPSRGGRVES
ncbi:MAG: DUF2953 domain-containing protein [Methanolinea sp.]|jgi:hypothetical protein|nr:DUF2953 domain-containing protein [Methanolinea sp.]